jgi:uncharacterized protein
VRVVLDHNILVSALLSPRGSSGQILAAYRSGRFDLVTSKPLLVQLETLLGRRKFGPRITKEQSAELLALLRSGAELAEVTGMVQGCRDPDDDLVLETAIQGHADLIVSGDLDLHDPRVTVRLLLHAIQVLTPAAFALALQLAEPPPAGPAPVDQEREP